MDAASGNRIRREDSRKSEGQGHFRPSRDAAVEQWARQSVGRGPGGGASGVVGGAAAGLPRRGSDSGAVSSMDIVKGKVGVMIPLSS